ncbi:hypothetical protein EBS02_06965 [bacterium]|nr:hypothetical protein [bacterium]
MTEEELKKLLENVQSTPLEEAPKRAPAPSPEYLEKARQAVKERMSTPEWENLVKKSQEYRISDEAEDLANLRGEPGALQSTQERIKKSQELLDKFEKQAALEKLAKAEKGGLVEKLGKTAKVGGNILGAGMLAHDIAKGNVPEALITAAQLPGGPAAIPLDIFRSTKPIHTTEQEMQELEKFRNINNVLAKKQKKSRDLASE